MTMATTYTDQQIALCFAYLAYTDDLLTTGTPSLDAQIASDLNTSMSSTATIPIPPIAGNWSLAWGPVSYTVPGALYQDNMMYVVQLTGATPPQFYVAVRGTNGAAELDWLLEDFDVLQMLPWPVGATGSAAVGNISESMSIGMNILLNMQDPATGDTLQQFLGGQMAGLPQTTTAGSVPICFTGHSLGAALASTSRAVHAREPVVVGTRMRTRSCRRSPSPARARATRTSRVTRTRLSAIRPGRCSA